MATTIKWIDNNQIETAHRIYKSSTYFTKDNLPAPLVELGPDITEYVDSAGVDGENWYIVSALLNDYEVFSEPFIGGLSTAHIHDIFGDGSAVATYNFDGDATDLGGNYNGSTPSTVTYGAGKFEQALQTGPDSYVDVGDNFDLGTSSWTFSFWTYLNSYNNLSANGNNVSFFAKALANVSDTRYALSLTPTGVFLFLMEGVNTETADVSVDLGVWQHVVVVIERDVNSRIYVNSTLIDDTLPSPSSATNINSTYDFGIGCYNDGSGNITGTWGALDGFIDQFRIFNRPLTQEEVDTLYQEGADFL